MYARKSYQYEVALFAFGVFLLGRAVSADRSLKTQLTVDNATMWREEWESVSSSANDLIFSLTAKSA
jgi:hypothetical protein